MNSRAEEGNHARRYIHPRQNITTHPRNYVAMPSNLNPPTPFDAQHSIAQKPSCAWRVPYDRMLESLQHAQSETVTLLLYSLCGLVVSQYRSFFLYHFSTLPVSLEEFMSSCFPLRKSEDKIGTS